MKRLGWASWLQIGLIILKLVGVIGWSWWWVLAPLLISGGLLLLIIILTAVVGGK